MQLKRVKFKTKVCCKPFRSSCFGFGILYLIMWESLYVFLFFLLGIDLVVAVYACLYAGRCALLSQTVIKLDDFWRLGRGFFQDTLSVVPHLKVALRERRIKLFFKFYLTELIFLSFPTGSETLPCALRKAFL